MILFNGTGRHVIMAAIGLLFMNANSQIPVLQVDIDADMSRKLSEVNEPGYISWRITSAPSTKTIDGITFSLKNGTAEDAWYKLSVMPPYYARLVGDGIKTSSIELHISGLPQGKHSLGTIHNMTSNPDNNVFSPIDIYFQDNLIVDDLEASVRVLSNDEGQTAFMEFDVEDGDTVVFRFESDPGPSSTTDLIQINGFYLNKANPKKLARSPFPADQDEHVDIDSDTLVHRWSSPDEAVSFNIYTGTNETDVFSADSGSPQFLGNITDTFFIRTGFYSMDSNFWRVDPVDTGGFVTKGEVWYFKKRMRAFPEAEGYGGYAIGGRGGKVVYVTNLNSDGPGSFYHAVKEMDGPRTILFAVSGLITLNDRLVINDDYITVAGQSAPGKGVCFRWAPIGVVGDDLIVQNIRMRLGIGVTYDGMGLTGANHSIIDHCSVSWTLDEAFSSRGAENITLQRTLISEALNQAGHDKYSTGSRHGYAASIGGDIGSFHHNLLAHCYGRNWSLAGGLDGDGYYSGRLDIFNNVVYNWGTRATDGGAHEVNFVGNYYKKGAATTQSTILKAQLEGTGKGSQSYYYANNIVENTNGSLACDGTDNTCSRTYVLSGGQILDWEVFVDEPFFQSQATIHTANDAYKYVLSDVGCTQPVLDDHDIRIIDETLNGTYSLNGSLTGLPGLPDHEKDVGGWEAYTGYVRSSEWDTDLDGLPDWWEKAFGLNPNSAEGDFTESNTDADSNGYTRLEEYLHWMDRPHYFLEEDSVSIDLSEYTKGFTDSPVHSITGVVNGEAELLGGTSIVNFKPSVAGLSELEFKVTDAEGTSMHRKIGFFKGQIPGDSMFTYTYQLGRTGSTTVTVDSINTVNQVSGVYSEEYMSSVFNVLLFPNPASDILNVMIETDRDGISELSLSDIVGNRILNRKQFINRGTCRIPIDVSGLESGMYVFEISNTGQRKSILFIRE